MVPSPNDSSNDKHHSFGLRSKRRTSVSKLQLLQTFYNGCIINRFFEFHALKKNACHELLKTFETCNYSIWADIVLAAQRTPIRALCFKSFVHLSTI